MASQPIAHRHDILILFEVTNGNPNGDPDLGNQPRVDAKNFGLVSDVSLKRKVRNYVQLFQPSANGKGFNILIQQGAVINQKLGEAENQTKDAVKAKDKAKREKEHAQLIKDWVCNQYYDVRTFGAVISTGTKVMKGSAYGQVRGPAQFTFGRSFHSITPQEVTITRCAVTTEKDALKKEREMGQKYIVPYALYAARCYISPAYAEHTGFDEADYRLLVEALSNLFEHDHSAARGDMVVRGLFDFEHVGSQPETNPEQSAREARIGCAHAHRLFETIEVDLAAPGASPSSFADYRVAVGFDESRFPGVKLHVHVDPR